MQLGMVGLGRMGGNIVRRLLAAGHHCVAYDRDPAPGAELAKEGAQAVADLPAMVAALQAPRAIWVMLPAGAATEAALVTLAGLLSPGDVLIDGGNSMWKDSIRRGAMLREKGLHFLDIGTSGGVWGLSRGYCLMIGGEAEVVARLDPLFQALVPGKDSAPPTPGYAGDPRAEQGYVHAGPNGAGHFTKMIHNGIEYGMMQAFAEGLDILHHADSPALPAEHRLTLNLPEITEAWRRGSVVASWLLDLTAQALAQDPKLEGFSGHVSDSGEGRWTVDAAVASAVQAPVLAAALFARFASRDEDRFSGKVLSAQRKGFGGHLEAKKG
ncbi:decarboxylating 6-phosphogluconate dehydrogenase [Siccirubricoccus sp. KC 17139]|uniref:Decarboxylating 6-phosphogluconate dehydrogenase n=1 Tax=Siccirubricoccus soli TaxID=2899147 RepID=A0ABT1DBS3_9PROT|nr:decarboxylating 6-phosphogluconate dehydrogenase [Siccirubricoccus soli]MCO6419383.1 decarboxylating 6-phosphogluconate dehydrogenase [Siccirubricoccus soli]MCP2685518.1 decarboxylating 6-phosphogluconate dehydrogenase [Siccirubricoccus soli]